MKVSIFIDGNNFYHGLRNIYGEDKSLSEFDFGMFSKLLAKDREVVDIYYYNAQLDNSKDPKKYKKQQDFFSKLKEIKNFNLILCKLLKRRIKGTKQYYYVLKEDDIHMAVDMVEGAFKDRFDIALIISGDGDFVPAVKSVQGEKKKVENLYFKNSSSRNLKKCCDSSIRLTKEILDKCFRS